ncbi:Retrovirus-related Pol polyprotein from type-2 retrotransposable element R2DM [Portunus trituberculatus]|uniref:Retrovirus-related Pol polyprotein from type-2 retrotransposable element R2DM n=1 Tax=Portunus trituberculatus TaxID=210409 RepID=A0A5B7JEM6_PORTR|nr:Retrovirus-related Pol polyprotein from type-2 retrotransposable element R2DM [Portunus trituberculatus]
MRNALYATADDRGLSGTDRSPPTHDWVGDGTLLMRGSTYVNALKTRLGLVNTRLRSSRGRPNAPVNCDLGCGRPESLGHILQSCPKLAPERSRRHDRVLDLLQQQLGRKNWQVLREPHIRTQAGVRVPDLVIWDRQGSTVLDVQVVADNSVGDFLTRAHDLKRSYYDVGDINAWVREKTGHPPMFTTLTINWRGTMASQPQL